MIIVAVDVDKDKHNCFITNTDDEVLFNPFIITNSQNGFEDLSIRPADLDIRENVETRFPLSSLCIVNSTKYICIWNPTFRAYLAKRRAGGSNHENKLHTLFDNDVYSSFCALKAALTSSFGAPQTQSR